QVQFFQRVEMVYHPDSNSVELRLLGSDATKGRNFAAGTKVANDSSHQFYDQTSHTVANAFLRFFQAHGGPDVLGYPLSDEMSDQLPDGSVRPVQYFQRARLEYHPELAGKPGEVSAGLLGDELLRQMGWLS
ncbi:MAG: vanomycin resistance protein VanB, partial [Chloroflexi bacterium]|nr:vanomycin resistance protein VanB [Chloroflexota bacterium]